MRSGLGLCTNARTTFRCMGFSEIRRLYAHKKSRGLEDPGEKRMLARRQSTVYIVCFVPAPDIGAVSYISSIYRVTQLLVVLQHHIGGAR